MFKLHPKNRDVIRIDEDLRKGMMEDGWYDACPLWATHGEGGNLLIFDGHNRFLIARELGIPVKYVIDDNIPDIQNYNKRGRVWALYDYLSSYVRDHREPYVILKRYHVSTGICLSHCIGLLAGETVGSNNKHGVFKSGAYTLGDLSHARVVEDIVLHCKKLDFKHSASNNFVRAISRIARVDKFNPEIFKQKAEKNPSLLKRCTRLEEYMDMINEIYNRNSKYWQRLNSRVLAEEAMRERTPIKKVSK